MIKKWNNLSLVIGVPGVLMQVGGAASGSPALQVLGSLLVVVALAFYAKAKARNMAWCLMGFLPIIGIIVLGCLEDLAGNAGDSTAEPAAKQGSSIAFSIILAVAGVLLGLVGFMVQVAMVQESHGNEAIAYSVFFLSVLITGVVAWLIVRRKGHRAKALATAAVGVLMLVLIPALGEKASQSPTEPQQVETRHDDIDGFKERLARFQASHSPSSEQLRRRYAALDLSQVASADAFSSPAGLQQARATTIAYDALAQLRDQQAVTFISEYERFYMTEAPALGISPERAAQLFGPRFEKWRVLNADLARAQSELVAALTAAHDWAGHAAIAGRNGEQLLFATQQDADRFNEISGAIDLAEQHVQSAQTLLVTSMEGRTPGDISASNTP